MTQHPLQFDPNRKDNDTDSLSDTWSQADTLLEELPKARQRKEAEQPDNLARSRDGLDDGNAESPSQSAIQCWKADDVSPRKPDRSRQGLWRK